MSVYNYTKESVAIDRLTIEIGNAGFSTGCVCSTFNSPNLSIFFDEELTPQEQTTLSGLVASHSGQEIYLDAGMVAISDGEGSITFAESADEITNTTFKFTNLFDAPDNYEGHAGDLLQVTTSGVRFVDPFDDLAAFRYKENLIDEYSTSTNYVVREIMTSSGIENGIYRLSWYYEYNFPVSNFAMFTRIFCNEHGELSEVAQRSSSASDWFAASGFAYVTISGGEHSFTLEYKSGKQGAAAGIRKSRMEMRRVNQYI